MARHTKGKRGGAKGAPLGPSQRQLRAGELVRHALSDILCRAEIDDPALKGAPATVTEVRLSPDLKHAICYVIPLLGSHVGETIEALNRHARYLRGQLGREIDMRFTPDLKFVHDESFEEGARMDALLDRPEVRRDLEGGPESGED